MRYGLLILWLGAHVFIPAASAWNYGSVTCFQPRADDSGKVVFVKIVESRDGPEGSAVEDWKKWRAESVAKVAGPGSLPGRQGITVVLFRDEPTPTVNVDIGGVKVGEGSPDARIVISYTITCVQLTLKELGIGKVRVEIVGRDEEITKRYSDLSGTYVLEQFSEVIRP